MAMPPTRRDRWLALALLLAVIALAYLLLVHPWFTRPLLDINQGIAELQEREQRVQSQLQQRTAVQERLHQVQAALARGKRFPRLALQMIQVGEESGALDTMLLKTADTFEQETARSIDRMLSAMVPSITLVLASVVGLVIIAVLVPMYDLTNAIG